MWIRSWPTKPEIDEMLTMEPPAAARIAGTACFMPRKTPLAFTFRSVSQADVLSVSGSKVPLMPALLTRMSSLPNADTVVLTAASQSGSFVTSSFTNRAWPPDAAIFSTTWRASNSRTSATTTLAPSRAKIVASLCPMPLAPPVTIATFPVSLIAISFRGPSRPASIAECPHRVHCGSPTPQHQGATMATYVLVHGAYQGGWIWKPVVDRLRAAGHQVYAPTLDGCAERHHLVRPGITVGTHGQEIAQLMFYEDLAGVVLVGTSSGGMVICKAAELARDRIAHLAFVDALALMPGERVGDIVKRPSANETTSITTGPSRGAAEKRLFADLDPGLRAWALARYTPHPIAALEAPVELGNFWTQTWPTTVIRCRRAANPPEAHQRRTAERLKAAWHELDTGHYPMLSQPEELTRLLLGPVS